MRPKRWARSGRIAAVFGLLALALTGCSAKQWERNLRFGWPTGVTKQATEMRVLWTWTGVTALCLGVVMWSLIFWACIRYRKRKNTPDEFIPRQTKYNAIVEAVCFTFPFIVIAGLFYRTVVVEDSVNHLSKNPDVLIQVDAFKWNWQFEYHTYRGIPSQLSSSPTTEAYTTSAGKQLPDPGNPKQPYYLSTVGASDLIPVLVVPKGQTVQVIEQSYDVIHSFWVPEFLFKRDVIPYGTLSTTHDNRFEFTATTDGSFVGRCAELCGTYHSQMNFEVRVVEPKVFVRYLAALKKIGPDNPARQQDALAIAMPGHSPYATTTFPFNTDPLARKASEDSKTGGS